MSVVCPITLDREKLRSEVLSIYAKVADNPQGEFHFHRGLEYAARLLGYDAAELDELPAAATASFAGVGNPFLMDLLFAGATVVDIGSGAGMDCLLAARRIGRKSRGDSKLFLDLACLTRHRSVQRSCLAEPASVQPFSPFLPAVRSRPWR